MDGGQTFEARKEVVMSNDREYLMLNHSNNNISPVIQAFEK